MESYQDKILRSVLQGKNNHPIEKGLSTKKVKKIIYNKEIKLPNGDIEISKGIELYKTPLENNSLSCTCGCGGIGTCMNKDKDDISAVAKYVNRKVKLEESRKIKLTEVSPDTWVMAGAGLAVPAAGMIFSAGSAIKGLVDKFKYSMLGCTKIIDPQKKLQCEQQNRMKLISQLESQLNKCNKSKNPDECRETLQNKINQEREKVGLGAQ